MRLPGAPGVAEAAGLSSRGTAAAGTGASAGSTDAAATATDRASPAGRFGTRRREALFFTFRADTFENVQAETADRIIVRMTRRELPPGRRCAAGASDTGRMKLSRPLSWFLLAFGAWSWVIWTTFVKNLWKDGSGLAFDAAGNPTAYFWVHLLLAITSFLLGTGVGVIGFLSLRRLRRERTATESSVTLG
ncbi:hypothetical protein GCM10010326_28470 [Streptomyces xanthochromogenes]|uniref:Integral membrane protein n=2 Tax=Streptomyces TaxID=1883 RepID=A0ABQ3A4W8_9ACTN|nr:hypothetical protein GCM10010326_28470 [Streptomyces xanthochromogenes]